MNSSSDVDTVDYLPSASAPEAASLATDSSRVQVDLAALTHQGYVRANNEDHYLVVRFSRALQTLATSLPAGSIPDRSEEVGFGMVVTDGLGGMPAGEVASEMAIRTLVKLVLATPDWMMRIGDRESDEVMQRMAERYGRIDAVLQEQGLTDPSLFGMSTTMTVAASIGFDLFLAHLGDSRAYLLRRGELIRLTRDHTAAQESADRGVMHPAAAASRLRHVLTRTLGGGGEGDQPDLQHVALTNDDQILLCTDGLTNMVSDDVIATVLRDAESATHACQVLVELALKNGGKDNVTVVQARYHLPKDT